MTMPPLHLQFPAASLLLLLVLLTGLGVSYEQAVEHHLIQVNSLLPSSVCNPSPSGMEAASMELVHKHGPCSGSGSSPILTAQTLQLDEVRARSIQSASVPAKNGVVAAAGDYVVGIGLGTPTKKLNLIVDTGNDAVWTLCKKGAAFDPFVSTTYANVSCERSICGLFTMKPGVTRDCSASTCTYAISYGDKSFSSGFLAHDKLTIGTDSVPEFFFGCAQNYKGKFAGASGVLGLGRGDLSVNDQMEEKYHNSFSYCLPSKPSYVGRLSLGKNGVVSKKVKYTPLVTKPTHPSKYIVKLIGISVGGVKLGIPRKVLTGAGTVIDSGTAISRLPNGVYITLIAVWEHAMVKYPKASPLGTLDHCYNFKGFKHVSVPKISLFFKGGVEVPLHSSGILIGNGVERMCLAFSGSENDSDVSILGNVQQRTLDVVYNVGGGKIGFGVNGCQ